MNIAIVMPYGDVYSRDRLFDSSSCKLGENLLIPGIKFKERMEELGHNCHTADLYNFEEIDVILFYDIGNESRIVMNSVIDAFKYIIKKKWKRDYLYKLIHRKKKIKSVLIAQEPPVIFPNSYNKEFHQYFDYVMTWNDDLMTDDKYKKFQYPQVKPDVINYVPFEEKRLISLISSNKISTEKNELYSKRYEFIKFMESHKYEFDLFGMGWQGENLECYRGAIDKKYEVQSKYKFSICYENMCNIKGYITEKIFDCFFCGTVPIYWGAENIAEYIPKDAFIDRRNFTSNEELYDFINNMTKREYSLYIRAGKEYINSNAFINNFSVDTYISKITDLIL